MKPAILSFLPALCLVIYSCNNERTGPSENAIEAINLKKGDLIWCGPQTANFGSVHFLVTASPEVRKQFDQAIAILHSFEYIEAEKAFANIIRYDPSCAMAYWGVAMSNFHPLWEPPSEDDLEKGAKAINIARALKNKTDRETNYIEAIASYYDGWKNLDHKTRCRNYEKAMLDLYKKYPQDKEAAIFYALALNTTADPTDKSYANQKKAGEILQQLYTEQPDHPGIIHYIIHNYDNPDLAIMALPAARKYASIAPASAHAQHMPSHIFVRLGLWDEAISSNIASINAAKCYAEKATLSGNFDEELHGLDYLVYAYLQKGDRERAAQQWQYIRGIKQVSAQNTKVAYAFAAIPSRCVLENKQWNEAANLTLYPENFPWDKFPWQQGIVVFTRLLGKVKTGNVNSAVEELNTLKKLQKILVSQKDAYKAKQLEVQVLGGEAWIESTRGNKANALQLMKHAADLEDATEKHPVTPGEVLPARELLADMLMQNGEPSEALQVYQESLARHTNRLNGLLGAATAAEACGKVTEAKDYRRKIAALTGQPIAALHTGSSLTQ